jgi:glutathione peroxidase-family protein
MSVKSISRTIETLPLSIYDIKIKSADGKNDDVLADAKGKVTLLFNVAAGCGNIPQHGVIEQLHQMYKGNPDFTILAVVVDDFVCHGYEQFQGGLASYAEKNALHLTPGQVAKDYAQTHFGATYEFTELTNGRYDKHSYSEDFVPNTQKLQDIHELWFYLTRCHEADFQENGTPYSDEFIPWAKVKASKPEDKKGMCNLTGNFTKFLIDKTGTQYMRYHNGFLLGERSQHGEFFPWWHGEGLEKLKEELGEKEFFEWTNAPYPSRLQQKGIDESLRIIKDDIDYMLNM